MEKLTSMKFCLLFGSNPLFVLAWLLDLVRFMIVVDVSVHVLLVDFYYVGD